MALTLEEAIARVPLRGNAKDLKTRQVCGGITNLNYKIDADQKSYVLRITGAGTEKLGIRRDVEHQANLEAGKLGVAPEVVYFIEPEGYLLTRSVKERHIPPDEIIKPENIIRVVRKIRLFHQRSPELKGEFNVFRRVEWLTSVSKSNNCKVPFAFDWIMMKKDQVG